MRWTFFIVLLAASLGTRLPGHAADVDLYGQVKDAGHGNAITGARVTVLKESKDRAWTELVSTRTNENGAYEVAKIPVGKTKLIFDKVPYKQEVVIVTLQTPPVRREFPMSLILLTAAAPYFKKVGESKAAWLNRYLETAGAEQAGALYRWEWYSCVIGLSASQTKLCADGLYGNVSAKIPKPVGLKPFATVDMNALAVVDQKFGDGSAPTLIELQQTGISPEVAWFTKWQRLEKSGASAEEIERTRKTLSENWKLPPDRVLFFDTEMRYYPAFKLPQGG